MHFQTPHVFATVNERVMPAIKILRRYSSRYLQFQSFLLARCYENYLCRYARFYTLITDAYDALLSSLLFNAVRTRVFPSPFFQTLVYLRDLLRTSRSTFSTDIFFLSIFIFFPFRRYWHSLIQAFFIIHRHFLCSRFLKLDSNYLLLFIPFVWDFFPFCFLPLSSKTNFGVRKTFSRWLIILSHRTHLRDVKYRKTKRVNCVWKGRIILTNDNSL